MAAVGMECKKSQFDNGFKQKKHKFLEQSDLFMVI